MASHTKRKAQSCCPEINKEATSNSYPIKLSTISSWETIVSVPVQMEHTYPVADDFLKSDNKNFTETRNVINILLRTILVAIFFLHTIIYMLTYAYIWINV